MTRESFARLLARDDPATVDREKGRLRSFLTPDQLLDGWGSIELQVMNQNGVRTEKIWFEFAVDRLHWADYAGKNFTDRQRVKRKAANWGRRYQALPRAERLVMG